MTLHVQLSKYALVGVAASLAHYSMLIGLVELGAWRPVPATLVGYVVGGVVSYRSEPAPHFRRGPPARRGLLAVRAGRIAWLLPHIRADEPVREPAWRALSSRANRDDGHGDVRFVFHQSSVDLRPRRGIVAREWAAASNSPGSSFLSAALRPGTRRDAGGVRKNKISAIMELPRVGVAPSLGIRVDAGGAHRARSK